MSKFRVDDALRAIAELQAQNRDLLSACQRTVRLLEQREGHDALVDSTLNHVRAAIAGAEGRQA